MKTERLAMHLCNLLVNSLLCLYYVPELNRN